MTYKTLKTDSKSAAASYVTDFLVISRAYRGNVKVGISIVPTMMQPDAANAANDAAYRCQ